MQHPGSNRRKGSFASLLKSSGERNARADKSLEKRGTGRKGINRGTTPLLSQLSLEPAPARNRTKRRAREEKPTALTRAWVRLDASGNSSIVHADKLTLTSELGIQPRDLRLLESQVVHQTSVILCRERAIVINMAFVKTIITQHACYIVSPDDDRSIQFMAELKARLQAGLGSLKCSQSLGRLAGPGQAEASAWAQRIEGLPFELRVLEICIDELVYDLDERAEQLERMAYPAVDAMAKSSSRPNLERVRRVKTSLIQLYKASETFLEALQDLLDNDKDMWELNLTAKEGARLVAEEAAAHASMSFPCGSLDVLGGLMPHTMLATVAEESEVVQPALALTNTTALMAGSIPTTGVATALGGLQVDHEGAGSARRASGGGAGSPSTSPGRGELDGAGQCQSPSSLACHTPSSRGGMLELPLGPVPEHSHDEQEHELEEEQQQQGVASAPDRGQEHHAPQQAQPHQQQLEQHGEGRLPALPPVSTSAPQDGTSSPPSLTLATLPSLTILAPRSPSPTGASGVCCESGNGMAWGSSDGGAPGHWASPSPGRLGGLPPSSSPFAGVGQQGPSFMTTPSQNASLARLSRRSLARLSMRHGSSLASSSAQSSVYDLEVAEVEMMLEAYFSLASNVHRRLKNLSEYIEDTEEMVYSSLNAKRNRLLAYDLCFIGINTISMALTAVSGLFTMNLALSEDIHPSTFIDLAVVSLSMYILFGGLLAYYMHTGVVQFT